MRSTFPGLSSQVVQGIMALSGTFSRTSLMVSFSDIEPGDYAIRYFHDENNNGAMDTNLFGLPVEGFGFSNNAKVNFGPPSYQQAAFKVAQQTVKNNSTVNY